MTRQIRFNAFDMNCDAHQSSGLWRHPDDRSRQYNTISYWTELAKLLESATFDGIFIADVLGTYDVFGGTNVAAIRNGAQVPVNDPILLVSAMAAVTEPATRMWFSFSITASNRPMRWLLPPPQRTAYFCARRRPGIVLRVSRIFARVPRTAST